jgi:hypothetical protein
MGTLSTYDKARWRSGCFPPPPYTTPVHSYGILALAMGYYSSSLSSRETRARSGLRLRGPRLRRNAHRVLYQESIFVSVPPDVSCEWVDGPQWLAGRTYAMHVLVQLHACMQSTAERTCSVCNVAIRPYFLHSSLPLSVSSLQPLLLSFLLPPWRLILLGFAGLPLPSACRMPLNKAGCGWALGGSPRAHDEARGRGGPAERRSLIVGLSLPRRETR